MPNKSKDDLQKVRQQQHTGNPHTVPGQQHGAGDLGTRKGQQEAQQSDRHSGASQSVQEQSGSGRNRIARE